MTAPDRKFTLADVRRNEWELQRAASRYLNDYSGDFDFLCDAQRISRGGQHDLSIPILKGVLNCMVSDVNYEWPEGLDPDKGYVPALPIEPRRRPALAIVQDYPRNITVPLRIKADYWFTSENSAKWHHRINHDPKWTYAETWHQGTNLGPYLFYVRAVCGKRLPNSRNAEITSSIEVLNSLHTEPCPKCWPYEEDDR